MASYTLQQFAVQALRDIGCLRSGQSFIAGPNADIIQDILTAAQQLVDAWLLDELLVPFIRIDVYTLTAGTQYYTIGPNETTGRVLNEGNITTKPIQATRPTRIQWANLLINTTNPVVRQPIEILRDDDEWGKLRVQQIPFAIPYKLYYDHQFDPTNGFGVLYLWPGPLASYQLEVFTWQQIQNFADAVTAYSFGPGYARFIRKTLAVEIVPMMRMYVKERRLGIPDPIMLNEVKVQAKHARRDLERYNAPEPAVVVDQAFQGTRGRGTFSYGSGDVRGTR